MVMNKALMSTAKHNRLIVALKPNCNHVADFNILQM